MSKLGTIALGIKAPIIKPEDDICKVVIESLKEAVKEDGLRIDDRDILCITEAVVAKGQNNFASLDDIAFDVRRKMGKGKVGLIYPIFSRNRFAILLEGIAKGVDELILVLSYPKDEVGNSLVKDFHKYHLDLNKQSYTVKEFKEVIPEVKHEFTGVDYLELYESLGKGKITIVLSNNPLEVLKYTDKVIVGSIHNRNELKEMLLLNKAKKVITLAEILNEPVNGSGFNSEYGILGSNASTSHSVKLFPKRDQMLIERIQEAALKEFGKNIEVMVYGDGGFKDPVGGIWELADPVVSPMYSKGLEGTPNEIKLKYLADNDFKGKENIEDLVKERIKAKAKELKGKAESLGTTPRRYTDLVGSLADLVSGSGDKGTPFVLVKNYFKNYSE